MNKPKKTVFVKKRRNYKKKSTVSATVKNYVKKTIAKDIENKSLQINSGASFGSYTGSLNFNAYPLLPYTGYWTLGQGVGAGARVGNRVTLRKLMLNYVLRPMPYDATTNPNPLPCEVLLYLGYVKNNPSILPDNTDFDYFFQSGSSSLPPHGSLRDSIAVPNKDYWVIKKRWSHKIGYANNNGTGGVPAQQYHANNDFKYNVVKRLNITKHAPKMLTFNDGVGGVTTRNLFLMFEAVSANGAIIGAPYRTCNIDFWIDFEYDDA